MPFKSQAQRAYLFSKLPKVAAEFAAATPAGTKLPVHVKKSSKKSKYRMADGGMMKK